MSTYNPTHTPNKQNAISSTYVNAWKQNCRSQDITTVDWRLQCTCTTSPCACMARRKPYILCVLGVPIVSQTPLTPTPPNVMQFTYCHIWFPPLPTKRKPPSTTTCINTYCHQMESQPSHHHLHMCQGNHPRTLDSRIRTLQNTYDWGKKLMKHTHQITIKYLTYLTLNKRKLDNKKAHVDPTLMETTLLITHMNSKETPSRKE